MGLAGWTGVPVGPVVGLRHPAPAYYYLRGESGVRDTPPQRRARFGVGCRGGKEGLRGCLGQWGGGGGHPMLGSHDPRPPVRATVSLPTSFHPGRLPILVRSRNILGCFGGRGRSREGQAQTTVLLLLYPHGIDLGSPPAKSCTPTPASCSPPCCPQPAPHLKPQAAHNCTPLWLGPFCV